MYKCRTIEIRKWNRIPNLLSEKQLFLPKIPSKFFKVKRVNWLSSQAAKDTRKSFHIQPHTFSLEFLFLSLSFNFLARLSISPCPSLCHPHHLAHFRMCNLIRNPKTSGPVKYLDIATFDPNLTLFWWKVKLKIQLKRITFYSSNARWQASVVHLANLVVK